MKQKFKILVLITIILALAFFSFINDLIEKKQFNKFLEKLINNINTINQIKIINNSIGCKQAEIILKDSLLFHNISELLENAKHPPKKEKRGYDISLKILISSRNSNYILRIFKDIEQEIVHIFIHIENEKKIVFHTFDKQNTINSIFLLFNCRRSSLPSEF